VAIILDMEKNMKILTVLVCLMILVVLFVSFSTQQETSKQISNESFLRIHIRANSNSFEDQEVKYKVKKSLVDYMTPKLAYCLSKQEAIEVFNENKKELIDLANKILKESGFEYQANLKIRNELFPTRAYDDVVLESGYYDAVIVELGSAKGDNWWCVVYPPLCFVDYSSSYNDIQYRSKILEIINNFFK